MEDSIWVNIGAIKNPLSKYTVALLKAQRRIENSQLTLSNVDLEGSRTPRCTSTALNPRDLYSREQIIHAEMVANAFRDDAKYYKEAFKRKRDECKQLKNIASGIAQKMELFANDTLSISVEQY